MLPLAEPALIVTVEALAPLLPIVVFPDPVALIDAVDPVSETVLDPLPMDVAGCPAVVLIDVAPMIRVVPVIVVVPVD